MSSSRLTDDAWDGAKGQHGDPVAGLRLAISRLRSARSVPDLLARAASELCGCAGADLGALLRVEGDEAVLQALYPVIPDRDTGPPAEHSPFSLRQFPAESAVVRRQRATLVGADALAVASAGRLPWPAREISCAVAPIVAGGRVIGIAYAGWAAPSPAPGDDELAVVWAFAEAFGAVMETVWLLERLELQLDHVRPLLMAVGAVLAEVSASAISLAPASAETLPSIMPGLALGGRAGTTEDLGLTQRQLEVLDLMAGGATNARIAAELTVTEATVKSHVRTILRKLNVANRAEAVGQYAARQAR